MPFLELKFRIGNIDLLTVGFGQTKVLLTDWRPAFKRMHEAYAQYQEQVFATEGRAGLGRWKPLSPMYKRWKERHFPGRPILTRTGKLRAAAKTLLFLSRDRLAMGPGNLVPYAIYHESPLPRRMIPLRPFVRPSPRMVTRLREIARQHIVEARRKWKDLIDEGRRRG